MLLSQRCTHAQCPNGRPLRVRRAARRRGAVHARLPLRRDVRGDRRAARGGRWRAVAGVCGLLGADRGALRGRRRCASVMMAPLRDERDAAGVLGICGESGLRSQPRGRVHRLDASSSRRTFARFIHLIYSHTHRTSSNRRPQPCALSPVPRCGSDACRSDGNAHAHASSPDMGASYAYSGRRSNRPRRPPQPRVGVLRRCFGLGPRKASWNKASALLAT